MIAKKSSWHYKLIAGTLGPPCSDSRLDYFLTFAVALLVFVVVWVIVGLLLGLALRFFYHNPWAITLVFIAAASWPAYTVVANKLFQRVTFEE